MRPEIGVFKIKDIKFGDRTMRCKVSGEHGIFPGVLSEMEIAGSGRTHCLQGCSLLVVGEHAGGFQDGVIAMGGKYQHHTIFGDMPNLVLVADTDEEFERHEQQKKNHALRWAGMRLAEYTGQCVKDLEPENIEVYDLPAIPDRSEDVKKLPGVLYVLQPQTQMEAMGYNTLIYGWDGNHILPTLMHPNELLDGYGNPDVDYTAMLVELERLGIKTVGLSDEYTGRDGASQPLVSMNPATNALVTTGNVSQMYDSPQEWKPSVSLKHLHAMEIPAVGKDASNLTDHSSWRTTECSVQTT